MAGVRFVWRAETVSSDESLEEKNNWTWKPSDHSTVEMNVIEKNEWSGKTRETVNVIRGEIPWGAFNKTHSHAIR